jgi:pilus assembly protein CpaE
LKVALVGSSDRQLLDLLHQTGAQVSTPDVNLARAGDFAVKFDVIVLDLRGETTVPPFVADVRRQSPDTAVVMVVSTLEPALLVEAMRAGINELVTEPLSQSDLEQAIARVAGRQRAGSPAHVFGFIGAKGGVGTTTVAVNVAIALGSLAKPDRCLLIDLHQAGGDAALFLGVEPRFSVLDALENTKRLDQTFLRSITSEVAPHVDLLASPDRATSTTPDAATVRTLIDFAADIYKYVVLDLHRGDSVVLDSLDRVSRLVIVANQELPTVKAASRLAGVLRQRYGPDKISVVLGRTDRQADIGYDDVERTLGLRVTHTVPSEYRTALQALNKGRPMVLDNHNDLSAAFKQIALDLAGVRAERESAPRTGLFGRLRRT